MRPFLLSLAVGLLACGPTVSSSPSPSPLRSFPVASASPSAPAPGVPVRLRIPSLKLDSPTVSVGLMPDGSVGTPCDPAKPSAPCNVNATAWYTGSARPGEPGSAVIDGHVDWYGPAGSKRDVPAVFAQLDRIQVGAEIVVVDSLGVSRTFVVDWLYRLPYPQQPDETYAKDGPSTLTLITCAGVYVGRSVGMSQRLYVHAILTS